jgi:recombination protein RecA
VADLEEIFKKRELPMEMIRKGGHKFSVPRISFGSFDLDLLTGGGYPEGRFTEIYGNKGSTKSSMVLRMIRKYLDKYPDREALLVDFEHSYEEPWARHFLGDTIDRLNVLQPDFAEQGIDLLSDIIRDEKMGLFAIDSLATMVPLSSTKDGASAIDSAKPGWLAVLINKMFNAVLPTINAKKREGLHTTGIIVNQLRAPKIGGNVKYSPDTKPGGYYQDFLYSLDIRLYAPVYIKPPKGNELDAIATAVRVKFVLEKNKLGLTKRVGNFQTNLIDYDGKHPVGSVNEADTIIEYAKKTEL